MVSDEPLRRHVHGLGIELPRHMPGAAVLDGDGGRRLTIR